MPLALSGESVDVTGACPAVSPTGDVYVAWVRWNPYPSGPIDIEIARSTNGGVSSAPVTNPLTGAVNPRDATASTNCGRPALGANTGDGIRYFPFPQMVVGPDGCLQVVYSYDPDGNDTGDVIDVFYRRSCDNGASWGTEVRLNDDSTSTDQWSPTVSVGPDNVVVATWYDRRKDTAGNYLFDTYKVVSQDGGRTWGANIRVSDVSSPVPLLLPNFDPVVASCYHGDRDQQVQDDDYVYITWSDDRNLQNKHPDPDIWFEKEPLPDSGQVVEITFADSAGIPYCDGLRLVVDPTDLSVSGHQTGCLTGPAFGCIDYSLAAPGMGAGVSLPAIETHTQLTFNPPVWIHYNPGGEVNNWGYILYQPAARTGTGSGVSSMEGSE